MIEMCENVSNDVYDSPRVDRPSVIHIRDVQHAWRLKVILESKLLCIVSQLDDVKLFLKEKS
jgi:hypothetical protein